MTEIPLPCIITSGDKKDIIFQLGDRKDVIWLSKPVTHDKLINAIRQIEVTKSDKK